MNWVLNIHSLIITCCGVDEPSFMQSVLFKRNNKKQNIHDYLICMLNVNKKQTLVSTNMRKKIIIYTNDTL